MVRYNICRYDAVVTNTDVNLAFQHAARNVLLEDDSLLQHFKFEIAAKLDRCEFEASNSFKKSNDGKTT